MQKMLFIYEMMTPKKKQRTTLFIRQAIAKHARAQAVLEDISLSELVEKALTDYLPKETVINKHDDASTLTILS